METINSVLYVDFDNVYTSIKATNSEVNAEFFATNPQLWLRFLETAGCGNNQKRIFRKKIVYINPVAYSRYRSFFIRSGIRIKDCPPLTALKKTATDIYMVVDIMKDLEHHKDYDDFVILSADADFSPVLFHINECCKNSVLMGIGMASTSYKSIANVCLSNEDFFSFIEREAQENINVNPPLGLPTIDTTATYVQPKLRIVDKEEVAINLKDAFAKVGLHYLSKDILIDILNVAHSYALSNREKSQYAKSVYKKVSKTYKSMITPADIRNIMSYCPYDEVRMTNDIKEVIVSNIRKQSDRVNNDFIINKVSMFFQNLNLSANSDNI